MDPVDIQPLVEAARADMMSGPLALPDPVPSISISEAKLDSDLHWHLGNALLVGQQIGLANEAAMAERIATLEAEASDLESQCSSLEQQVAGLEDRLTEQSWKLVDLEGKNQELKVKQHQLKSDLGASEEAVEDMTQKLVAARNAMGHAQDSIKDATKTLQRGLDYIED